MSCRHDDVTARLHRGSFRQEAPEVKEAVHWLAPKTDSVYIGVACTIRITQVLSWQLKMLIGVLRTLLSINSVMVAIYPHQEVCLICRAYAARISIEKIDSGGVRIQLAPACSGVR